MTTRSEIEAWYNIALNVKASYMVVVTDTFDWIDYPVFVMPSKDSPTEQNLQFGFEFDDINKIVAKYSGNMQRVTEVYMMSLDKEMQLNEHRAYHLEG